MQRRRDGRIFIVAGLLLTVMLVTAPPAANNPYGTHVMIQDEMSPWRIEQAVNWTRNLAGEWGYIKSMIYPLTPDIPGALDSWKEYVRRCGEMHLIPVFRMDEPLGHASPDSPDGTYGDIAAAYARVAADLLKAYGPDRPLYFEIRNEPNNANEWSNDPDPLEYGRLFVAVAQAIHALGDPRAKVCNGALSPGGSYDNLDFTLAMTSIPGFPEQLDCWCSHSYPGNLPPEQNLHNGSDVSPIMPIDAYLSELVALASGEVAITRLPVLITEFAYNVGAQGEGFPTLDQGLRTDYVVRAWRDYWRHWPEVQAVTPYYLQGPHDPEDYPNAWIAVDSDTDAKGWPTRPLPNYEAVAALAKPGQTTGSISGVVTDAYGNRLAGAHVHVAGTTREQLENSAGFYIFGELPPGIPEIVAQCAGYEELRRNVLVPAAADAVMNFYLESLLPTGEVAGQLTELGTDEPVEGAFVEVLPGPWRAPSDEQGRFRVQGIIPGTYDILITRPGYDPRRLPAREIGAAELTISLGLQANLLNNGSLEALAKDTGAVASGWSSGSWRQPTSGVGQRYWLDPTIKRGGMVSQRIECASGTDDRVWQFSGYTAVEPAQVLRGSAWIKTIGLSSATTDPSARMVVNFYSNGMEHLGQVSSQALWGTQDWQQVQVQGVAPPGVGRWEVALEAAADSGSAFFDDVQLRLVEPKDTEQKP